MAKTKVLSEADIAVALATVPPRNPAATPAANPAAQAGQILAQLATKASEYREVFATKVAWTVLVLLFVALPVGWALGRLETPALLWGWGLLGFSSYLVFTSVRRLILAGAGITDYTRMMLAGLASALMWYAWYYNLDTWGWIVTSGITLLFFLAACRTR